MHFRKQHVYITKEKWMSLVFRTVRCS